jgi:uncharacterized BrkB/YihY/UPF0761 family membrane protein
MAGGSLLASGLATKALFALLPGLLLLVSIVGFLIRDPAVRERIYELLSEAIPPIQELLTEALRIIADGALAFSIVSLIGLVWGASGFLQSLDVAFAVLLGQERRRDPFIRGLLGVVGVGIALGAFVAAALLLAISWQLSGGTLFEASPAVTNLASIALVAVAVGGALGLAYRLIPSPRPTWGAVGRPALVIGLVIAVLTQIFALLAPFVAGLASLYGAIATVFVLILWLQFGMELVTLGISWVGIRQRGFPDPATLPWPAGTAGRPGEPSAAAGSDADGSTAEG